MSYTSARFEKTSQECRDTRIATRAALAVATASFLLVAACSKESPEALIRSAQHHIAERDYRTAQIELKNAIETAPANGAAYRWLGSALLSAGDPQGAEAALRKALSLAQSPDDVLPGLAIALIHLGRPDRLTDEFGTRRLQAPDADAPFQASLGQAWLMRGDFARAGDAFATALSDVPGYPPARLGQARIAAQGGRIAEASVIADEVLAADPKLAEGYTFKAQVLLSQEHRKDAGKALEQALAIEAGNLPARLALASLRIEEREYDAAQTLLEPTQTPGTQDLRLTYLRSFLALREGNLEKARDEVSAILGKAPDNVAALILAGEIELRSDNADLAQVHLEKALYADPSSPAGRKLLAATFLRQGRPVKALDLLQPLLAQVEHGDAQVSMLAGEAYLAEGDAERASDSFERAKVDAVREPAARLKLGQIALARGDFDRGVGELQAASAMDAQHEQADLLLFSLHMRRHEFDKALAAADSFTHKQPSNPLGYVLTGTAQQSVKDQQSARQSFDAALKIRPRYLPALRGLASLDVVEGKPGAAMRLYESPLAEKPGDEPLLIALAELQERIGKVTEAGATLRQAIAANPRSPDPYVALVRYDLRRGEAKAAVAVASQGVAANPAEPRLVELLGDAQQAAGASNDAIRSFEELARRQPQSLVPLIKLAAIQAKLRDFSAAARTLRLAQQSAPDNDEIARKLVAAYLSASKFDEALGVAKVLKVRKPGAGIGPTLEGDVNVALPKWPQAERAYRAALAVEPQSGAVVIKLCRLLAASGRKAESAAFAATWLARNPADIPVRMYVANVALNAQDYKAAALQYETALRHDPDDVPALNNLAWTLGELKDPRAMGLAERAAVLSPDSPLVLDTLGMLQLQRGEIQNAIGSLARVRQLAPDRKDLRLHYAMGLLRAGRTDEGKAELKELMASQEDFPGKATIPALLGKL